MDNADEAQNVPSWRRTILLGFAVLIILGLYLNKEHTIPDEYGVVDQSRLTIQHTSLDEHTTADIIEESGLGELIRKEGISKDSTYIVGTLGYGSYSKQGEFMLNNKSSVFRMGLSLQTNTGKIIKDTYKNLPDTSADNQSFGTGNYLTTIIHNPERYATEKSVLGVYAVIFCTKDGKTYESKAFITLKGFDQHCYYIKDVPPGTAYYWFQFPSNGGLTTQIPIKVQLTPVKGKIVRHDFQVDGRKVFMSL